MAPELLESQRGIPCSGLVDWHLYCVLWAFTTNEILCLYSRSTLPLYKVRRVDHWPKSISGGMDDVELIIVSWNFLGLLLGSGHTDWRIQQPTIPV
jgi:hypothetical protein